MRFAKTISALIFASLIVATASDADAAKKRRQPKTSAPELKPHEVLAGHIFLNRYVENENLATSCKRSNFGFLAIALDMNADWLNVPKGEFETTLEFEERHRKLADAMGQQQIVICEPVWDNPDIGLSYNADAERFEASFSRSHNVWREVKPLGSYRSSTRMGVRATVKSSLEMNFDVSLKLPDELKGCLASRYGSLTFSAPVGRDRAPVIKRSGKLVIVGKLVAPYIQREDQEGSPTLDDPYDVYVRTLTVIVKPARLVLIGPAGEEIWSCKPTRFVPSSQPTPIGDKSRWLMEYDIPYGVRRDQPAGSVETQLTVGSDGKVKNCTVLASSGSAIADEAACKALRMRANFTPAADADGEPIESYYKQTVRWNDAR